MPNLKGIGLQNFRTFKDYEYLEFAPITLITGANNSGKSSIFKAIMLLKSVYEDKNLTYNINNKHKHTMSSVSRIVNNSSEDNFLSFTLPLEILRFRNLNIRAELRFEYNKRANNYSLNRISIKRNISMNSPKDEQVLYSFNLTNDNEYTQVLHVSIDEINIKETLNLVEYKIEKKELINNIESSEDDLSLILDDFPFDEEFFEWQNGIYKNSFKEKVEKKHKFNLSNENWVNDDIEIGDRFQLYQNIDFNRIEEIIRHSKTRISTDYFFKDTSFEDYDKFTNLNLRELELLITEKEKKQYILEAFGIIYRQINIDIGKNLKAIGKIIYLPVLRGHLRSWYIDEQKDELVDIFISYFNNKKYHSSEITTFINQWIGEGGFNIGKEIEIQRNNEIGFTRIFIVLNTEKNKVKKIPLTDLGYGASQLLPIILSIANIAYSAQIERIVPTFDNRIILIEEPEANLHPNLQSKLAEFFIDATSRFNIQFILETHSEYLIYKFQEYIGKEIIKPNDVVLYYLNQANSDKKYVNPVLFNEDGSIDYTIFKESGFFDVQMDLRLSLLNIQRDRFVDLFESNKAKFGKQGLNDDELLEKLGGFIDEHFDKIDYKTYQKKVIKNFPNHELLQDNSKRYLASAYHLMRLYDEDDEVSDYSAAVIQFGRAVECEFMCLFKSAKDYILDAPGYLEIWTEKGKNKQYSNELNTANMSYEEKHDFKDFINEKNNRKYKITFGKSKHAIQLMINEDVSELNKVNILRVFNNYLSDIYFKNWDNIKVSNTDLSFIVDLRNKAAHTYNDENGENRILKNKADDYEKEVKKLLNSWTQEMKFKPNHETNNIT